MKRNVNPRFRQPLAPPPPGAPAPFTREDIERMVNIVSNMLGEIEHHENGSLILMRDMLIAYAPTFAEGRQENGAKISGAQR